MSDKHVFDCGHEAKDGDFGMTGHFGCVIRARKCPDCLGWERGDRIKMLEERIAALRDGASETEGKS